MVGGDGGVGGGDGGVANDDGGVVNDDDEHHDDGDHHAYYGQYQPGYQHEHLVDAFGWLFAMKIKDKCYNEQTFKIQ